MERAESRVLRLLAPCRLCDVQVAREQVTWRRRTHLRHDAPDRAAVVRAVRGHVRKHLLPRHAGAEAVGEHKTSMLQDVEHGRALELDALLGSVIELARLTGTPTPHCDAVYACASLLGATLAARNGRLQVQAPG